MALALRQGESALALRQVNLPSSELAARLPAQRRGDPLGLGIERPAPPLDPDAGSQSLSGARDLLSAVDRSLLDAEVRAHGFLTPVAVRSLIAENCTRGQLENGGLDPEFLLLIDARIDYKLYIAGDSVYTREELYANFPFYEFGVQPEAVFVAQEVGLFEMPRRAGATRASVPAPPAADLAAVLAADLAAVLAAPDYDYAVRDVGDQRLEFSPAEDLVRAACGGGAPRKALRIIQTKVYVGREAWEDFTLQMRFYRGAIRIAAAGGASLALTSALVAAVETPAVETPAVEKPAVETPAVETPAGVVDLSLAAQLEPDAMTPTVAATNATITEERVLKLCSELELLKQRVAVLEAQIMQRQIYV